MIKNKKQSENCSNIDSEDENLLMISSEMNRKKGAHLKYEIINVKTLPSIFFVLFLVIFSFMILKFVPNLYNVSKENNFYNIKSSAESFQEYLSEENLILKVLITGSQLFYSLLIISLTSLIKQRISVPELYSEKKKNYLIIFFSMITVISIIGLTFYQNRTMEFTKAHLGLSDNILFLTYLICSFMICLLSISILLKMETLGLPKDENILKKKKLILYIIIVNIMLYISCLSLVSYYKASIKIEKVFISIMFLLKEINAIMLILNFMLFTLSLKYDLSYIHLNLKMRPDMEYFVEYEKINYASML